MELHDLSEHPGEQHRSGCGRHYVLLRPDGAERSDADYFIRDMRLIRGMHQVKIGQHQLLPAVNFTEPVGEDIRIAADRRFETSFDIWTY